MYSCYGSPHPPASPGNMQTAVPGAFTKICARRPNPLNPLRYDRLITSLPEQLRRLTTRKQYSLHHLFILNKLDQIHSFQTTGLLPTNSVQGTEPPVSCLHFPRCNGQPPRRPNGLGGAGKILVDEGIRIFLEAI